MGYFHVALHSHSKSLFPTALRGAAILKTRTLKDVRNNASVIPYEKGGNQTASFNGELAPDCHESDTRIQDFLARGGELLKRTRKGLKSLQYMSIMYLVISGIMLLQTVWD